MSLRLDKMLTRIRFAFCGAILASLLTLASFAGSVAVKDDGDPGFSLSTPTAWSRTQNIGYDGDHYSGVGSSYASWSFSVNAGTYRISLTWPTISSPYNKAYSSLAPVTVLQSGQVVLTTAVNQQIAPGDRTDFGVKWKDVGIVEVDSNPLEIRIAGTSSFYSIADAVRIERVDGTPILTPSVASVSPSSSPLSGGIPITIKGSLFSVGTRVYFGAVQSSQVTIKSSTELVAIAPSADAGTVDVKIVTPDGLSAFLPGALRYAVGRILDNGEAGFTASQPASVVTGKGYASDLVYPAGTTGATASWTLPVNAKYRQKIAVTWYNAGSPYNKVFANAVTYEILDGATVIARVPANLQTTPADFTSQGVPWKLLGTYFFKSGQAKVVLRNDTSLTLLADAIRVEEIDSVAQDDVPVVSSISPNSGSLLGGTLVTINGSGFVPGTSVKFGSTAGLSLSIVSGSTITVLSPLASVSGSVSVTVTTPGGTITVPSGFTYLAPAPTLPTVTISASDLLAGETGSGAGTGQFKFTRTGSTANSLTVYYSVSGSATSGTDYNSLGTSVVIPAGAASVTKTVTVIEDSTDESDETVSVRLASKSTYLLTQTTGATVTIKDDDGSTSKPFVTSYALGKVRNDSHSWVGMRFRVGSTPITITSLGRFFKSGNAQSHELRIVSVATGTIVASVIWTPAGGVAGAIKYATLSASVTLAANSEYYLVSKESIGGDSWYHRDSRVTTTSAATVLSAAYFNPSNNSWTSGGAAGNSYGPVGFRYR
jgi:hypothetical protein